MGRKFCRKVTYHPQGNNNKALIHREKIRAQRKIPSAQKEVLDLLIYIILEISYVLLH